MVDEQPEVITSNLSKEQKTGFVLLLIFGILGITLGFLQIRNTLLAPFALTNNIPASVKEEINDPGSLKYRDTDNDGLSDYDELYLNGTSPYLYDTFGYGFSDKELVEKGLPRCANAGQNCSDASTVLAATSTGQIVSGSDTSTQMTAEDFEKILSEPSEIRKMLIAGGMDKNLLESVSDAELMQLVFQLMASST